ncbi:hypothetical protein [Halomonas alkaliantarctica]|nr:hypothetical protein [Halomonas alkaliantarctica]
MQERRSGSVIPESPHCHSRVGLSGIHLDLSLQQPENPAHRLMPVSLN